MIPEREKIKVSISKKARVSSTFSGENEQRRENSNDSQGKFEQVQTGRERTKVDRMSSRAHEGFWSNGNKSLKLSSWFGPGFKVMTIDE